MHLDWFLVVIGVPIVGLVVSYFVAPRSTGRFLARWVLLPVPRWWWLFAFGCAVTLKACVEPFGGESYFSAVIRENLKVAGYTEMPPPPPPGQKWIWLLASAVTWVVVWITAPAVIKAKVSPWVSSTWSAIKEWDKRSRS